MWLLYVLNLEMQSAVSRYKKVTHPRTPLQTLAEAWQRSLPHGLLARLLGHSSGSFKERARAGGLDMFAMIPKSYFDIPMGSKNQSRPITWGYFMIFWDIG